MKIFILFFATACLLTTVPVYATGGWSSGGGELIKDAHNPWFLKNVKKVTYCVSIDEKNFGIKKDLAETKVAAAINFWKHEFESAVLSKLPKYGAMEIASQDFQKIPCSENVDLRFQFGTLNERQRRYIKNPKDFGAVTIRTTYEPKTMRGAGFIYVSPARGALAYDTNGRVSNAWAKRNGELLFLTLAHELGHIFGIPHSGSMSDLMSEAFVANLLSDVKADDKDDEERPLMKNLNYFSIPTEVSEFCIQPPLLQKWTDFFNLKEDERCVRIELKHDVRSKLMGPTQVRIVASGSQGARTVADLTVQTSRFHPTSVNLIWLPDGQTLFVKEDLAQLGPFQILGTSLMTVSKTGTFNLPDAKGRRAISVRFEQGKSSFTMDAVNEAQEIITLL